MFNLKMLLSCLIILLLITRCSTQNDNETISFNFNTDLDGWSAGISGKQLDSVEWVDWTGMPPGCVKLDGSDFGNSDHLANSWIYKNITIPVDAISLSFLTSAHDRENANSELRVSLVDQNQVRHILINWELANTGIEDEFRWISKNVSIEAYSGQTVTLYFEQGDNDIGVHEQRYIDKIEIK